jgi:ABC-type lipoprotein release transport system permease subunit
MRIPLLRGRALAATDRQDSEPVVLINQNLAETLFPGADPIGHRIQHPDVDGAPRTVVGVVGNLRRDGPSGPYTLDTYSPLAQTAATGGVIVIRTDDPESVRRALPAAVASVEPSVGTWSKTLNRRVRDAAGDSIRISILLGGFAAIALLLSALGLYAMVSYATVLKTRELGIRSALGSPPRAVLWLVMRSGLWWLAIGSGLGLVAALWLGQTLAVRMPGAHSFDLRVYVLVGVSLLGAGSLAAFLPARRAVRASPALALRYE